MRFVEAIAPLQTWKLYYVAFSYSVLSIDEDKDEQMVSRSCIVSRFCTCALCRDFALLLCVTPLHYVALVPRAHPCATL
jgi:hypothetical protein